MFAQNVLSSHLYGHTVVKDQTTFAAHPPVYAGFGRTGRTGRMELSLAPVLRASASRRQLGASSAASLDGSNSTHKSLFIIAGD